jgi:ABC-type multidrug transport system fused ATPase/permease subunit
MSMASLRQSLSQLRPAQLFAPYAGPVGRVWSFIRNYYDLFMEGTRKNRWKMVVVILFDAVGAVARGAVIGVVAYFVKIAETGQGLRIAGTGVVLDDSSAVVAALSGCVFGLSALSAYVAYESAVQSRALARDFYVHLSDAVLGMFAAWRPQSTVGSELTRARVVTQITRNALHASLSVENVLKVLQPVLYMVMATCMLFGLDPLLALVVLPILLPLGPLVYRMADQTRASARDFYTDQANKMGQTVSALVTEIDAYGAQPSRAQAYFGLYRRLPALVDYLDGFDKNQLANDRMTLVLACVRALSLTGAIALFGTLAVAGERGWAEAVAFVGALLYLLNSAQSLLSHVSTLSRFYPQVVDFSDIVGRMSCAEGPPRADVAQFPIELEIAADSSATLTLDRGSCIAYWSPFELSRITFMDFMAPLVAGAGRGGELLCRATFVSAHHRFVAGRVIDNLAGESDPRAVMSRLDGMWPGFGASEAARRLHELLEHDVQGEAWLEVDDATRSLASLLQVVLTTEPVVLLDAPLLRRVSDAERITVLELLRDRLVIVSLDTGGIPGEFAAYVVTVAGAELNGQGDKAWFNKRRPGLRKRGASGGAFATLDEMTIGG